jgi:hypothetical protein
LDKGENRLVQLNEFVKTNMLQKIKFSNRPEICQKVYTGEFFLDQIYPKCVNLNERKIATKQRK